MVHRWSCLVYSTANLGNFLKPKPIQTLSLVVLFNMSESRLVLITEILTFFLVILPLFAQYTPVAPSNSHIAQLLLYYAIQLSYPNQTWSLVKLLLTFNGIFTALEQTMDH